MQERSSELNNKNTKTLVLFSSGLDSAYNLLLAKKTFDDVTALFFDYGQRAAAQEYLHVKKFCKKLGVNFIKIDLPWYRELNSTLLSATSKPSSYNSINDIPNGTKPAEWVPNRNGVLVNVAAAIAESTGAKRIVIGVNLEESGRYPDNTIEFLDRANALFEYSTLSKPFLSSFSGKMLKTDIVGEILGLMKEYGLSKEYIWSCYDSYEKMCGRCESCIRLRNALKAHGRDEEWKELFLR